ncbi:MAG TPA: hypothetical protein VMT95_13855 [Candidatus Binatia bacterium]|nr:hypothetical protein [Candidatus Binatia bacterium]
MRPLSEVFAPGAPTLPERLRTLVVSPERELEPGITVRATFTFRNQGGAPATGVRLRFNAPDGLIYLVGSGRLDGNPLDDELGNSPLLSRAGADIGDVAPDEERRIDVAYSVAGAIENGTTVELQAALASFELPPIGSNVVRLVARSKPQLRNALTRAALETAQHPVPGSEAALTIYIHNAGESSARDVVVVAPIPEHTTYVAGSARVNGRDVERELGSSFDKAYAPIVVRSLPASASATVSYRIRIDSPLCDGTNIVAEAQVASQETAAFALDPASLTVSAVPDFSDERTSLTAEPATDVRPGGRVRLTLTAHNAGTAAAARVTANFELGENLIPVRGASTIDGSPARDRRKEPLRFALGPIDAGEAVTLCADAVLASPLEDDTVLTAAATLDWEPARDATGRRLHCDIAARSEPAFSARRNFVERKGSAIVRPGAQIEAAIELTNDGSAAAHDAVLHLRLAPELQEVAAFENSARLSLDAGAAGLPHADTIDLGGIAAQETRRVSIRARVPSPCPDRRELLVGASLHTRELGETPLREAFWRVDSHPAFAPQSSKMELADDSALRPNQLAQVDVLVTNTGTDVAHNARLRLYVSAEARLETVEGATRDKSSLSFGDIAPGGSGRARLGLRLLRSLAKEYPVTIDGVLTADAMLPVPLARLTIATAAEADFSIGSLRSDPADAVDVGDPVEWVLHVRNGGDGVAHQVAIFVDAPESLIYVPNSTTVNDVAIRDAGSSAPFAAPKGIVLNEVDPGVEAAIRWRTVVHNGLPAGTTIAQIARVRYDGEREDQFVSPDLKVRSGPVFANAIAGLPFGLDGVLGPALGAQRALTEERFMELPPATPVGEGNGAYALARLTSVPANGDEAPAHATGTLATFTSARLERALRFLREARFGGLVTHLFVVRAFLPEAIGDTHCGALAPLRDLLREELDRLFIKLRLPRYAIAPRDVETPSLRSTIERVLHEAALARGVPADPPTESIALRGSFDSTPLHELAERLGSAELATAAPWAGLARLLPNETSAFARYRSGLVDVVDRLADADSSDFIEELQQRDVAALDAELDAMLSALHETA